MKKLFGLLFLASGCATSAIHLDDIAHKPDVSAKPGKPTKLVSGFADLLKAKVTPSTLRASSYSCPAPVSEIRSLDGTVFRFSQPTICVRSILGEPICKVGFTLSSVTPNVETTGGVTRNGRMFNVPNNPQGQGFDSRAYEVMRPPTALPQAFLNVGDAMITVRSKPVGYSPGQFFDGQVDGQPILSASVITADTEARICTANPIGENTTLFRRAPFGDKTLAYKLEDFFRILPTFPTLSAWPGAHPDLSKYYVGSVGMQAWENWGVRGHIPSDKQMDYGNYRAARQGERMLLALTDIPFEHRLVILVGLAQDAIDSAAAHLGGATYFANGGHNSGPHLAMVKWLGYLTGDNRFKQKGPIQKRFGEQFHLEWGTNYYVPSHTVNYNAFWDGSWQTEPSPASKPVNQYSASDRNKISYMLCCGAINWQAGYLALHILGELDSQGSETDRIIMQWIRQFRAPPSQAWNQALVSVGANTLNGWWGRGQAISDYYWPAFGF